MKHLILFFSLFLNIIYMNAQTFDVETIKLSGDNGNRINLVFMGDGYTSGELDKFMTDATTFSNNLFTQSPFKEYIEYFNVYAIKVPSNESGTDHPGTANDVTEPASPITSVDTYFNTSFDTSNIHRLLYTYSSSIIYNVLASNFPEFDQPIILVNSSEYGGAGGPYATSSTGNNADEIVIHELGHSLFDLKDEYYPGDGLAGEAINMTHENNKSNPKWINWMGINGISTYQHTIFDENNIEIEKPWYRPHQTCKMRYLGFPFCSVCKEGIIEKIHSLISPIDTYTPNNNTVDNPTFPLDFQLNLVKPAPNTLDNEWILNTVSYATNVDDVSLLESELVEGANTLTTVIHDNSTFLKVDNHDSFHVNTVTWTINYSSLGVEDIYSEVHNYNISLYPNPTNSILNLKFESNSISDLNVEIISIDGKKVKSTTLSNYEYTQVDIGHLSQGIYITNFYAGNALIASKRLVKN